MPRLNDLTGRKFGKLTVLEQGPYLSRNRNTRWVCACECGNEVTVTSQNLRIGKTKSCGCLRKESTRFVKHGHAGGTRRAPTATYRAWLNMRTRCFNPKWTQYADYGGRGISVCKRWDKFENFLADMGQIPAPTGYELDRVDVNADYAPANCRWIKRGTGQRRTSFLVQLDGRTVTLGRAAHQLGLDYFKLHRLMYRKRLPFEQAVAEVRSNSLTNGIANIT